MSSFANTTSTPTSTVVDELSTLVNKKMFPEGVHIHHARIEPSVSVFDIATSTITVMQVLVITMQTQVATRDIYLGMPQLGLNTIFGEITMGMCLYTQPSYPGYCFYNSQIDLYEVAIKRSSIDGLTSRIMVGGEANQENPINEIALMEKMKKDSQSGSFDDLFPHNMALDIAATDGTSLFTVLPRMKNSMDLFCYCFENKDTKKARQELPFVARMQEVKMMMRAILRAVAALHAQGIAHRDLSLENTLVSVICENSSLHIDDIKVIDYGMAVHHPTVVPNTNARASTGTTTVATEEYASLDAEPMFDFDDDAEAEGLDTTATTVESSFSVPSAPGIPTAMPTMFFTSPFCGKKPYAAPECYYQAYSQTCDPRAGDIWSCGIMLYALAFNEMLFSQAHHRFDTKNRYNIVHQDPANGVRRLLNTLLPRQVILQEPLLMNLLEDMLRVNPAERKSAEELLDHAWFRYM